MSSGNVPVQGSNNFLSITGLDDIAGQPRAAYLRYDNLKVPSPLYLNGNYVPVFEASNISNALITTPVTNWQINGQPTDLVLYRATIGSASNITVNEVPFALGSDVIFQLAFDNNTGFPTITFPTTNTRFLFIFDFAMNWIPGANPNPFNEPDTRPVLLFLPTSNTGVLSNITPASVPNPAAMVNILKRTWTPSAYSTTILGNQNNIGLGTSVTVHAEFVIEKQWPSPLAPIGDKLQGNLNFSPFVAFGQASNINFGNVNTRFEARVIRTTY